MVNTTYIIDSPPVPCLSLIRPAVLLSGSVRFCFFIPKVVHIHSGKKEENRNESKKKSVAELHSSFKQ